ncbi:hypothetical protein L596_003602 [Steinernema carpocapsae]|uniref:Potassium channel domain-containing protein n=1 Tax=Steinernema carpocapsae TaxID=34508 RepID=A0A4U8USZ8_STECR|nr:hypothetical protein L596_003602 [Steinernema carpocapsae]
MRRDTVFVPVEDAFDLSSEDELANEDEIPMEMDLTAAGPPISDDDTEFDNRLQSKQERMVKLARHILPHVGLVILLIIYLVVGAVMFHYIELPHEMETREHEIRTIFGLRDSFHDNIWNLTRGNDNIISRESFNSIGQEYFERLVTTIFSAYRKLNRTDGEELLWTYSNSIFFATTVITTIGYGNLVPATQLGRYACIVFALFGIPLLLVTIADIGKFLSDFLSFLYRNFRAFKRKVRKQSRRISHHYRERSSSQSQRSDCSSPLKAGSMNLNEIESDTESDVEDELRIPVIMVLFVLIGYTAVGGLLFRTWEGWPYADAFYFCFITMATIGFGDIVPTGQMYMFFTMAYIIIGLSLATMCIDLAGTEYIRKIHYLGSKMEDAKGAVMSGLQAGEHILKHTGIEVIRTAGGKLVKVRGAVLDSKQVRELGVGFDYILADLEYHQKNMLYEPLSQGVLRLVKNNNIKVGQSRESISVYSTDHARRYNGEGRLHCTEQKLRTLRKTHWLPSAALQPLHHPQAPRPRDRTERCDDSAVDVEGVGCVITSGYYRCPFEMLK